MSHLTCSKLARGSHVEFRFQFTTILPLFIFIFLSFTQFFYHATRTSILLKNDLYQIESRVTITGNLHLDGSITSRLESRLESEVHRNERAILETTLWSSFKWNQLATNLEKRFMHQMFRIGGEYFVTGGLSANEVDSPSVQYRYDPVTKQFEALEYTENLSHLYVCTFDTLVLGFGGMDGSGNALTDFYYFDYPTSRWSTYAFTPSNSLNGTEYAAHACSPNGMLLFGGEHKEKMLFGYQYFYLDEDGVLRDFVNRDLPQPARTGGFAGFLAGRFVFGSGLIPASEDKADAVSNGDAFIFEMNGTAFSPPQTLPTDLTAFEYTDSVQVNEALYILGGSTTGHPVNKDIFRYFLSADHSHLKEVVIKTDDYWMDEASEPFTQGGYFVIDKGGGVSELIAHGGTTFSPAIDFTVRNFAYSLLLLGTDVVTL